MTSPGAAHLINGSKKQYHLNDAPEIKNNIWPLLGPIANTFSEGYDGFPSGSVHLAHTGGLFNCHRQLHA